MTRKPTAIIEREGDGYVALCPEVDVVSRGDTVSEARNNLQQALTMFFETASDDEIEDRMRHEVYLTHVEVALGQAARSFRPPYTARQAGAVETARISRHFSSLSLR